MNILRKTRKSNIRISKKRLVLLIFSLIMTSFAWVAYLKVLNTNSEIHINSWNISLFIDKNKNGVAEASEEVKNKAEAIQIDFADMYPDMNEEVVDVIIKNNGETPTTIDYIISDIAFLGDAYKIVDDIDAAKAEAGENSENRFIQKNEYVTSGGLVTYEFINDSENFPFKILIENTASIDGGAEGHLKVKAYWLSSLENKDSLTQEQIDAKNKSDTLWGYGMAQFVENNPTISPLQFKIKINATGANRSSRYVLTQKITPDNYGQWVKYPIDLNGDEDLTNDWKIFYEGSENVYIIASDYINTNSITFDNVMKKGYFYYSNYGVYFDIANFSQIGAMNQAVANKYLLSSAIGNGNNNYKATTRLLDTSKWSDFVLSDYAEDAIGTPTVEMFVKSWNQKYIDNDSLNKLSTIWEINNNGYSMALAKDITEDQTLYPEDYEPEVTINSYESENLYFPHTTSSNLDGSIFGNCFGYWLASPSINNSNSLMTVLHTGTIGFKEINKNSGGIGIRPVVALKVGIKGELQLNEDTGNKVWELEK
ncbi:MAG: hypothetical protein IKL55_05685 [Clostridia bacterium]|nr:hypothetical protein [Clostridia bacterium]